MEISELAAIIFRHCYQVPSIKAAYIFGSRIKGTHRQDSDVDIAIEITNQKGGPATLSDWMHFDDETLRKAIEFELQIPLDMQWYGGIKETPTVHRGLVESSVCVYAKSPLHQFRAALE
ncbi:nucleotidyltransferase family protein [Pseudomonas fluvialis]|uniref:nucleotidyltransferase family protein n=1 Tax=Pseudomonas fluvialis TaxID=1793966 RepID=UPI0035AE3476